MRSAANSSPRNKPARRVAGRACGIGIAAALLLAAAIALGASDDSPAKIRFEEIGAKAGVRHLHHTRRFSGDKGDVLRMFTSGGSSVAVADYDNDGFEDIFV